MSKQNHTASETEVPTEVKKLALATIARNEADQLNITFSDSTALLVDPAELSDEIRGELMFLGLQNKLRDSWASAKGDVEFAKGAANKTLDNLKNGLWTASRASGPAVKKTTELVQAIANLKKLETAQVQAIVDGATEDQIAAWRKNAQVKAEILRIRAEAARLRAEKASGDDSAGFEI